MHRSKALFAFLLTASLMAHVTPGHATGRLQAYKARAQGTYARMQRSLMRDQRWNLAGETMKNLMAITGVGLLAVVAQAPGNPAVSAPDLVAAGALLSGAGVTMVKVGLNEPLLYLGWKNGTADDATPRPGRVPAVARTIFNSGPRVRAAIVAATEPIAARLAASESRAKRALGRALRSAWSGGGPKVD